MAKWLRILLGLSLIAYAANQFVHILPTSYGQMPENTRMFLDSIVMYLPYLYVFEMLVGALLIVNKWTGLILIMILPLSFGFLMFNFLNGNVSMMWPALFVAVLNIVLLIMRREQFKPLLE